ncbi:hypothetical protein ARMGADRAFT_1036708 [Armillaria gallica]|uniref:Uncharacterized protein n=1 Tax=Armillaria gallica TaxID=47427 RepID=A0A2H3D7F8_ARMGA|nr:hypothetical protein ARMGADRAFT_1036708 [Armillaria gallica]
MSLQPSPVIPSLGDTFGALFVGATIGAIYLWELARCPRRKYYLIALLGSCFGKIFYGISRLNECELGPLPARQWYYSLATALHASVLFPPKRRAVAELAIGSEAIQVFSKSRAEKGNETPFEFITIIDSNIWCYDGLDGCVRGLSRVKGSGKGAFTVRSFIRELMMKHRKSTPAPHISVQTIVTNTYVNASNLPEFCSALAEIFCYNAFQIQPSRLPWQSALLYPCATMSVSGARISQIESFSLSVPTVLRSKSPQMRGSVMWSSKVGMLGLYL